MIIKATTTNKHNLYYICIDGATSSKQFYFDEFNNSNNELGQEIKIIIGSKTLAEGVNLYNIREIHILEPWYNNSRIEQIQGRGIRQCSHESLEFENRNVTMYNYIAINHSKYTIDKSNKIVSIDKSIKYKDYSIDMQKLYRSSVLLSPEYSSCGCPCFIIIIVGYPLIFWRISGF